MFDTGSGLTLISKNLVDRLNLNLQPYLAPPPLAVNNSPVKILGQVKVRIKICDDKSAVAISTIVQVTEYLPHQFDTLIGQDLMTKANLIIDCAAKTIHIINSNLINLTSLPSAKHSLEIDRETEIIENLDQNESNQFESNEQNEQEENSPFLDLVDPLEIPLAEEIPKLIDKTDHVNYPNLYLESNSIKCLSSYCYSLPYLNCYSTLEYYQHYHHTNDKIINLNSHEPNDNVFNWLIQRSADEIT